VRVYVCVRACACMCVRECACVRARARAYTRMWVSLRIQLQLRIVNQLLINKLAENDVTSNKFGSYLNQKYFVRVRC